MIKYSKDNDLFFENATEMMIKVMSSKKLVKAAIYYPQSKRIEMGGLFYSSGVRVSRLPLTGYSDSLLESEGFDERYVVLKKFPFRYEDAVFYTGKAYYFDLKKEVIELVEIVSWNHYGYRSEFTFKNEAGEETTISTMEYGKGYVFLEV